MPSKAPQDMPVPVASVRMAPEPKDSIGLSESDYAIAAIDLGCEVAAIKAFAMVESRGRGFLPDGRPTILYEAHVFHKQTGGRFPNARDRYGVLLSSPKWNKALYGAGGAHQYERLEDAMKLDEKAAVFSCSWGIFQVMGFNFFSLGFATVDTFREFMESTDEAVEHLELFKRFIMNSPRLRTALKEKDWPTVALLYNGEGYKANEYDTKMESEYRRFAK